MRVGVDDDDDDAMDVFLHPVLGFDSLKTEMFLSQISWDGLERGENDETDYTVHTSACECARARVCVLFK